MIRNHRWAAAAALAGGAVAAAAIGTAPAACAEGNDDVFGQAAADLTQASTVLEAAPTTNLSAEMLKILDSQETLIAGLAPTIDKQEALQDSLTAAEQASPLLATADQNYLQAYDALLAADQAFAAADQAGDLGGQTPSLDGALAVFDVLNAEFGVIPVNLDLDIDDVLVKIAGDFGLYF